MNKTLRNTLYLSLAALMVGSLGSGLNNLDLPSANARRVHRDYHAKYYEISNYRVHGHYNLRLSGRHAVYSQPGLLRHSHERYSRRTIRNNDRNGLLYKITRVAKLNSGQKYYKVTSQRHIAGWVAASATYRNHKTVKPAQVNVKASRNDNDNFRKVAISVDRAQLLADFSKINFNDSSVSENDSNHAERYLAGAKHHTDVIKNPKLHERAYHIVKGLEKYMSNVAHVKLSLENTILTRRNQTVNAEVSAADAYLAEAGRHPRSQNAEKYLRLADAELNAAENSNRKLQNGNAIRSNGIAINNAKSYEQRISNVLNKAARPVKSSHSHSNDDTDVLANGKATSKNTKAKHTTPTGITPGNVPKIIPNNDHATMAKINGLYDATKTQFDHILGRDHGNLSKAESDAAVARNDIANMKTLSKQLTSRNAKTLASDVIYKLTRIA